MTWSIALVLLIVVAVAIALMSGRTRPDVVGMVVLVVLAMTGIVARGDVFAGFGRPAVIAILSLFIVSRALERTGATRLIARRLSAVAGRGERRAVAVVMVAGAGMSLFMNNIAAVAVLLPVVVGVSREVDILRSKLLIPLAFGTILGGMATLFTTANILVSGSLADAGYRPYGVLDFLPVGLPMAVVGTAFVVLAAPRLLPDRVLPGQLRRREGALADVYGLRENVQAVEVTPASALAGVSLAEGDWSRRLGITVVAISRGGALRLMPAAEERILAGDVVLFTCAPDAAELAASGLVPTTEPRWTGQFAAGDVSLAELVVAPRSPLSDRSLRDVHFRELYDLTVLALWRDGRTLREGLADVPLRSGDALLVQGARPKVDLLRDDPAVIVLEQELPAEPASPPRAWAAVGLTALALVLAGAGVLPMAEAMFAAALLMVVLGCLTMDEAYAAIEWRVVFMLACLLPLGAAMVDSGAARLVADGIVGALGGWGALVVAGGLFILATLLTQVIGGQVTPVVVAPVAIAAATGIGVDPRGMAMAVAMGCSMAFLTPVSHAANLLVMGPGGYTGRDFARIGLPLSLILLVVLLATLAVFWGIR